MVITTKLKQRFCTDCNIPINIFQEPYFTDRLKLYDEFYGTVEKWNTFITELENYHSEQEYFDEYNKVKDEAIDFIKSTEAYQSFLEEDMNQYAIINKNLPSKDIYHSDNDKKTFISIDMKKANFSALHFYDASIFGGAHTWEKFIGKFTDNQHIINSKYVRQVIMGNCSPKRQITYEKDLMMDILVGLVNRKVILQSEIVFFSNDEIVIDVTNLTETQRERKVSALKEDIIYIMLPLKIEYFQLHKIEGTHGYYKEILKDNGATEIKFKCLDSLYLPFVIRKFQNELITESDKVFYHNGLLAKLLEIPDIKY